MKMTLEEYISNPMGKGSMVIPNRELIRNNYNQKFQEMLSKNKDFDQIYMYKDGDKFILHQNIPSETVDNFFYDVVFEFSSTAKKIKDSSSLKDYHVKFFTNDPMFIYTYVYAFLKNDLVVDDLVSKLPKEARENKAKIKNRNNDIGYVKSIFFAYLNMKRKNLFLKDPYTAYGKKYSKRHLLSCIDDYDIKAQKRSVSSANSIKRKEEKGFSQLRNASSNQAKANALHSMRTKTSKTVGRTKTVGTSKSSKTVGYVKRK